MKNYIVKETEKAVCVEAKFENIVLENEKNIKIWIPKSCIEKINEKVVIKSWFVKNKMRELFDKQASYIIFKGLKEVN